MNIFRDAYQRSIFENQKQTQIWEEYLDSHKKLDLQIFQKKLKVPVLIPIGSRILFRGDLIHTNEFTVALGANYFVKCSAHQAEAIRQHRIKGVEEKLEQLQKEREYLENQLSFSQRYAWDEPGKEIIEPYNENDENEWKLKHRESVRKHKIQEKNSKEILNISDNNIWERLEELELKEELENEHDTNSIDNNVGTKTKYNLHDNNNQSIKIRIDELKDRLSEMKTQQISPSTTEEEIFKRLDQLEEQEALEDELNRLEDGDTIDAGLNTSDDGENKITPRKSITFESDYDNDYIEINFKHSDCSHIISGYDKTAGIVTPYDIYSAFPENFEKTSTVPILKKTKYTPSNVEADIQIPEAKQHKSRSVNVIGEIAENTDEEKKVIKSSDRPPSKFKTMRMKKFA